MGWGPWRHGVGPALGLMLPCGRVSHAAPVQQLWLPPTCRCEPDVCGLAAVGLQAQRCALPRCPLGPGAPLSAVAASLPELQGPWPQRRWFLTPGSRPWALGGPLGCLSQAGTPAEETPAQELPSQSASRALPMQMGCSFLKTPSGLGVGSWEPPGRYRARVLIRQRPWSAGHEYPYLLEGAVGL